MKIEFRILFHRNKMYKWKLGDPPKKGEYAGFDLDGTIIETKSGKPFPKDKNDWKLRKGVKEKLTSLKEGIIIITNQGGKNFDVEDFKEKIIDIRKELGISFRIYIACNKDRYRKPCVGIYDDYIKKRGKLLYYVGDAAGRKGDHNDTDLKFAKNLEIPFYTPEEFFLGEKPQKMKINYPSFDYKSNLSEIEIMEPVVILVGLPGAGKTWFCENYLKDYERINQDTLKTKKKCLDKFKEMLELDRNVVVDNTNPEQKTRKEYISLAQQYGCRYTVIWINTPIDICKHNMMSREYQKGEDFFSSVVYNVQVGKFKKSNKDDINYEIILPPPTDQKYYLYEK